MKPSLELNALDQENLRELTRTKGAADDLECPPGTGADTIGGGLGGQVRIGQAAIQHFSNVTWVVSKNLKCEHPYVALASAGLS